MNKKLFSVFLAGMLAGITVTLLLPHVIFFTSPANVKNTSNYGYVEAKVASIYDGDTIYCDISEWPPIIGQRIRVRIRGIDCPELRTRDSVEKAAGIAAREFTASKLQTTEKVLLQNIDRDKYFRIVADVYVGDSNLGDDLIRSGHAVRYPN